MIGGRSVYEVRKEMGRQLAREHRVKADLVIPLPDSGVCAALGYSEESGIPFEMAFIRNHYVGRSFLQPSQLIRDFDVRMKLNLIAPLVKNKRVVIVDDSIVRGTTCKARVKTLKEAGAREVHVAVSCPPHMNPCVYGIDFPDRSKLMAANHSVDEIRKYLNADSLHYLSQDGMVKATGKPAESFCMACYDGKYPVPYDPVLDKHIIERRKRQAQTLGEAVAKDSEQIKLLQQDLVRARLSRISCTHGLCNKRKRLLLPRNWPPTLTTPSEGRRHGQGHRETLRRGARTSIFTASASTAPGSPRPAIFWKARTSRSRPSSVFRSGAMSGGREAF